MITSDVQMGDGVEIRHPDLVNLYGCHIGESTKIGTFVEIQKDARVGRRCKISSHTFICSGVTIEDEVFVGHGVMFTNDLYPRATRDDGGLQAEQDWRQIDTRICEGASIGSNATILAGITVGARAIIGAGAVVTRSVAPYAIVAGVPARVVGDTHSSGPDPTPAEPPRS
ncbi:MAG TPA: N-acetyltransferase [Acidobacteria bacterium]|jgi:acetyltransferase-like isoleucine patch superfamily enzyme|nr:acyltransferase [Acidobacteriota bacterium]HCE03981.1 N-acetyltransferase [Acidobacteriota bacterium]|tara:strand:+ start:234 stop:743 length:510 start_codon:yes stop_codon:yes gene_type:complete